MYVVSMIETYAVKSKYVLLLFLHIRKSTVLKFFSAKKLGRDEEGQSMPMIGIGGSCQIQSMTHVAYNPN